MKKVEKQTIYANLRKAILLDLGESDVSKQIKEAVSAGFPLDFKDHNDWSLLFRMAWYNNARYCKLLLDLGADVNIKNNYGQTPFFAACLNGGINSAKLLIDAGARWDIPNNYGRLPLDALEMNHGKAVRDKLEEYIKEHYSQLHGPSIEQEPAYVQEL